MKAVIEGRTYDTETASLVEKRDGATLYQTAKGRWFFEHDGAIYALANRAEFDFQVVPKPEVARKRRGGR